MKDLSYRLEDGRTLESVIFQSTKDWSDIFCSLTDLITIHDLDFNIVHANPAAKRVLRLPSPTAKNTKCYHHYHGKDCPPEACPSCDCIKTGMPKTVEMLEPHLNKYIEIRAIPRFGSHKQIKGVIHIVRDITQRKESEENLRKSREKLRNLAAHLHSVREEERKSIAREIHDELAQALTALKMDLFWLNKRLPEDRCSLLEKITSMSGLIDTTISSVQRISSELRPGLLDDLGLKAAIEWQVEEFRNRTGIGCELNIDGEYDALDGDRAITIFRIFQEALTNVMRHAKASRVDISLFEKNGNIHMEINDDGRGVTEKAISDSRAFGLIGMRERAYHWGGKVQIRGTGDKGTSVKVSIPLDRPLRR
jgi:signal transduction histidine kinase